MAHAQRKWHGTDWDYSAWAAAIAAAYGRRNRIFLPAPHKPEAESWLDPRASYQYQDQYSTSCLRCSWSAPTPAPEPTSAYGPFAPLGSRWFVPLRDRISKGGCTSPIKHPTNPTPASATVPPTHHRQLQQLNGSTKDSGSVYAMTRTSPPIVATTSPIAAPTTTTACSIQAVMSSTTT
jgi:hypothetical protein